MERTRDGGLAAFFAADCKPAALIASRFVGPSALRAAPSPEPLASPEPRPP